MQYDKIIELYENDTILLQEKRNKIQEYINYVKQLEYYLFMYKYNYGHLQHILSPNECEKYLKELHHYERQYHIFVKEITCLLQELYSSEILHRQL